MSQSNKSLKNETIISEKSIFSSDESDSSSESDSEIKFMDEEDFNIEKNLPKKKPIVKKIMVKKITGNRSILSHILIDAKNYNFKTWQECFTDNKVVLRSLVSNTNWDDFFDSIENTKWFIKLQKDLSCIVKKNKTIVPFPELLFNSLNALSPDKIKVVILGQDPYPGVCNTNNQAPHAMGCSFSAPYNCSTPKSLINIFKNALKYGHIRKMPENGCLASWIFQGCFMINSAFTTVLGNSKVHSSTWKEFTKELLNYIVSKCQDLVFVLWGADAHSLCKEINPEKHCLITSSHPSPYSADGSLNGEEYGSSKNKKNVSYPAFNNQDHFGKVNNYLKSKNKKQIFWDF
ncbi:putative uracil-DNA glycosylase [Cotonvirus japonicus]|uniref:Uracil-DNA glycosylase n=1 Tax=Cotonvirus japonicus TaxID=2811091 RepID=A0ABM7NS82_9VIRU|nr:putative uracil-DNA glycosylase [Cotonvirus japonicus]BCS83001.1 putative uracil-DNA glycosylase [Cotonvirus japonicus]